MVIAKQGNVTFCFEEGKKEPYCIFVDGDCWYRHYNFDTAVNEYKIIRMERGVLVSP